MAQMKVQYSHAQQMQAAVIRAGKLPHKKGRAQEWPTGAKQAINGVSFDPKKAFSVVTRLALLDHGRKRVNRG